MNDEIKEILDEFDKQIGQLSIDSICHLFPSEIITIKDCITNLQEENERLTRSVVSYDETLLKRNNEYEDYKSRCEKAVDEIQQLIDDVNNKTIIGLNNFLPKLEEIQDKLVNGGDEDEKK